MTEKDVYQKGDVLLEEWEDVNYCEHVFKFNDEYLDDKEVVDLLYTLSTDNRQYKILVNSLKYENQKLKLRLKELGVEYY